MAECFPRRSDVWGGLRSGIWRSSLLLTLVLGSSTAYAIDTPAGSTPDTRAQSLPERPMPAGEEPEQGNHAAKSRASDKPALDRARSGQQPRESSSEVPDSTSRPPLQMRRPEQFQQAVPRQWPSTPGQLGLTVGVPFFDDDLLHGDVTVDIRYGRKFWWFVPYLSGGFRATRMDPARVPPIAHRDKVYAWHATLGMRLEVPATHRLFPFVGLAGEVAFWAFTEGSTEYCHEAFYPDAWRCYQPNEYKRGTALKPQIGLLYKPEASLALEFWIEYGVVQASEMFTRRVGFIHPAVGVAWHH